MADFNQRRMQTATGIDGRSIEVPSMCEEHLLLITDPENPPNLAAADSVFTVANPDATLAADSDGPKLASVIVTLTGAAGADSVVRLIAVKDAPTNEAAAKAKGRLGEKFFVSASTTIAIERWARPGYTLIAYVESGGLAGCEMMGREGI